MILNVSSRTDIVAFYSKWFITRYEQGFVDVRNPYYPKNISRIYFKDIDAILFCTKNPIPILDYLHKIDKPILFHITITPYNKDIEPNVANKKDIIDAVKKISNIIGIDNVYVRYDPILLNDKYTIDYHINAFNKLCNLLNGYVKHIIISFIDEYKNVKNNSKFLNLKPISENDLKLLGTNFAKIAKINNIHVQTCFEDNNLSNYGFIIDDCISSKLAYNLTNKHYKKSKVRKENKCNCIETVDIGVYNSCKHFCKYCYANYDETKVNNNFKNHDANSSLLIGKINSDDIIKIRYK